MAEKPRLKLPKEAKKGEIIEIKTLMPHVMQTGLLKDKDGKTIPRKILNKFVCTVAGKQVFAADFETTCTAFPFRTAWTVPSAAVQEATSRTGSRTPPFARVWYALAICTAEVVRP